MSPQDDEDPDRSPQGAQNGQDKQDKESKVTKWYCGRTFEAEESPSPPADHPPGAVTGKRWKCGPSTSKTGSPKEHGANKSGSSTEPSDHKLETIFLQCKHCVLGPKSVGVSVRDIVTHLLDQS